MRISRHCAVAFVLSLLLLACGGDDEVILAGERQDLRVSMIPKAGARAFRAPPQINHQDWTHRGGDATHKAQHPALARNLTQIWRAPIGQGNTRKARITADPVITGGRIFTMDSASMIAATDLAGNRLWSRALVPSSDDAADSTGGGLAVSGNTVIATTGFGETFALDARTGAQIWRQMLDAPVTASPAVEGDLVYVVSRDNKASAINIGTGRLQWQVQGTPSLANVIGGAGPALAGRSVIFPFGSGDLVAVLGKSGVRLWSASVAGARPGQAYAGFADVSSEPVVDGERIYVANQGGRLVAIDVASGAQLWSVPEGSYSPVVPAGGSVFLVSDQAEMIRLDAATGAEIWRVRLPYFTTSKIKNRDEVFAHFGPILAGGRLIVASDDGRLRSFDPETGALIGALDLPAGAASNPVIVGGVLYLIDDDGQLSAFR